MNKNKSLVDEDWCGDMLWYAIKMWWPSRKEKLSRDFIKRCLVILRSKK